MKIRYTTMLMMSCLLITVLSLGSCETEDDRIGNIISGHWFGDMDMSFEGERAQGSEIEFSSSSGWHTNSGKGVEIDYYRNHAVTSYFTWEVKDKVVYLWFNDQNLDCAIADYSLTIDYFFGFIVPIVYDNDGYSLDHEHQTPFLIRNYDLYWERSGYGSYYDSYVKGQTRADADSTCYHGIRGIYLDQGDN